MEQRAHEYYKKLKALIPSDKSITLNNILNSLKQIEKGIYLESCFHSNLTFAAQLLLLCLLRYDKKINIIHNKNGYAVTPIGASPTPKTDYTNQLIYTKLDNEKLELARTIIEQRNYVASSEFYQSFNTFESLKLRYALMLQNNDLNNKSVIFLGDDELFSVLYALNSNAKRIVVIDIDDRILSYIQKVSKEYNLKIEVYKHNIFEKLPHELVNQFDIFFASGLKDYGGLLTFLLTGIISLKDDLNSSGYITYYEYNDNDSSTTQSPLIYRFLNEVRDMNFYPQYILPCDEMEIPDCVINNAAKIILENNDCIDPDFCKDTFERMKSNNVMAADPSYPYMYTRPIYLAKIVPAGIFGNDACRKYNILQRFVKNT
ncbi:MAG: bis-aminopropyl spermidine synthase family protein [Dorea sp.]|jgi:hypothetical protein|nr:bis-aminopropyl spermidine synthase family protein [Clostridiales bacterium]MCI9271514.1 bis-aminopropyl spermidine synthase family protein [Dorea sp.]